MNPLGATYNNKVWACKDTRKCVNMLAPNKKIKKAISR